MIWGYPYDLGNLQIIPSPPCLPHVGGMIDAFLGKSVEQIMAIQCPVLKWTYVSKYMYLVTL